MRDGLMLAGILFALGLVGLLVRRNLIFMLMSIEVMLNAAGLAFVVGRRAMGPAGRPDHVSLHPGDGCGRSVGGLGAGAATLSPVQVRSTPTPSAR